MRWLLRARPIPSRHPDGLPRHTVVSGFVVLVVLALVPTGYAAGAFGGGRGPEITVIKNVSGEAPSGARYRVRLECDGRERDAEVVFGGPGSQTIDAPCDRVRAVEVETGGAKSVTYTCSASGGARCVSDNTIEFAALRSGQKGSFTVGNTFDAPTTTTSTTSTTTSTTSTTTSTTSTTAATSSTSTTSSSTSTTVGTTPGTIVASPSQDESNAGLIVAIIAAIVFAAGAAAIAVYLFKSRNRPDDDGFGPAAGGYGGPGGGYGPGSYGGFPPPGAHGGPDSGYGERTYPNQ
ncbi:MAG: hypothetical protein N2037_00760 [Acidimicrobiales bacterium]|nr:hypothetical protein [Acidimicrobiales bacterium]